MTDSIANTHPLLVTQHDGVVDLCLNRPERRNALSLDLLKKLLAELNRIAEDSTARVVVLSAAGPVFCSGHDLSEMVGRTEADYRELFSTCAEMMSRLRTIPQPVIARVQGVATAAGCQLVAACDLAVASDEARFATPGVRIGLFCSTPMVPLVRNIGAKAAMEMLLTGQAMSAAQAQSAGLINRAVPQDRLDATIQELTDAILATSPLTIRIGKEAFYRQLGMAETRAYADAVDVMVQNALCADAQEGISAFLGKRSPQWQGR